MYKEFEENSGDKLQAFALDRYAEAAIYVFRKIIVLKIFTKYNFWQLYKQWLYFQINFQLKQFSNFF